MMNKKDIVEALARHKPKTYGPEEFAGFARAAVLVPLVQMTDGLALLLTQRTESVDTHKGQISFPGGVRDHSNEHAVQTALRETQEELGIEPQTIEILGTLDERPVPTKFIITPIVGFLKSLPPLPIQNEEVAEVFSVPLSFFADDGNAKSEQRGFQGRQFTVWHFHYGKYHVWGATAAIIKDLIDLVRNP